MSFADDDVSALYPDERLTLGFPTLTFAKNIKAPQTAGLLYSVSDD